jgi:hypothetical protein
VSEDLPPAVYQGKRAVSQPFGRLLKNSFPKLISKEEGVVIVSFLFSKDFEEKRLL